MVDLKNKVADIANQYSAKMQETEELRGLLVQLQQENEGLKNMIVYARSEDVDEFLVSSPGQEGLI